MFLRWCICGLAHTSGGGAIDSTGATRLGGGLGDCESDGVEIVMMISIQTRVGVLIHKIGGAGIKCRTRTP